MPRNARNGSTVFTRVSLDTARKANDRLKLVANGREKTFSHIPDLKQVHNELSAIIKRHSHLPSRFNHEIDIPQNLWNRVDGLNLA